MSAKARPEKYKAALGEAAYFAVFRSQHATKIGLGQDGRTHKRTLFRNAHLNTITVTKTSSNWGWSR